MSILKDPTYIQHAKNFAVYAAVRSVLGDKTRYDEISLPVLTLLLEKHHPLYLEGLVYLSSLSEEDRWIIFSQANQKGPFTAFLSDATAEGRYGTDSPYPIESGIPVPEIFRLWQNEYENYSKEIVLEGEEKKSRSAPRGEPYNLFSIHSSAPVYDIGETIARGDFSTPTGGQFPAAQLIGSTEGRIEILPFWDHSTNQPLTPQHINLVAKSDLSEFKNMQEEAMLIATSYNEEMATYFYAMDAYWLMNAKTPDDYVQLDISDLLQYSGKKPVKTHGRYTGTYRPDQLQRAGMMVYGMGFSMVEIEKTIIKGVGERSHFKRLWDVSDMYMMETLDREKFIESMTYRPNELLRNASFGSRRETAVLMSKVLSLDYAKMVTARRLGRYYTWIWRDRAYTGNIDAPITCQKLLERAGIEIEKGNERYARRKLETALDRLEREEIISQWVLLDRNNELVDLSTRIPFTNWLEYRISVSPPDIIVSYYTNNLTLPTEKAEPTGIDPEVLKAERKRRGYTFAMLREETGIDISTLSRIEGGKTKRPRSEHIKALQDWLDKSAKVPVSE